MTNFKKLFEMKSEERFDYMLNNIPYDEVEEIRNEGLAKYRKVMQPLVIDYSSRCYASRLLELVGDCETFLFH